MLKYRNMQPKPWYILDFQDLNSSFVISIRKILCSLTKFSRFYETNNSSFLEMDRLSGSKRSLPTLAPTLTTSQSFRIHSTDTHENTVLEKPMLFMAPVI